MSGDAAWAGKVSRAGAIPALNKGDLALTARLSRQGLDRTPDDPDLLRLLLLTQLGLQEIEAAQVTAEKLGAPPLSADTLDALVSARLAAGRVGCARDLVARGAAEAGVPVWALEAARARIALYQGDLGAARAILVRGIERTPDAAALRVLMLEVLVADGDAAHAREVTARLGQPATAPGPEVFDTKNDTAAETGSARGA